MLEGSARRFCPRVTALLIGLVAGLAAGSSLLMALLLPTPARAQNEWGASYVTPFPEDDVYRLQVVGDGMAEGVFSALAEAFRSDTRVRMPNGRHRLNGFIRMRPEDFFQFEETIKSEPIHIAVVMLGASDRVALRAPDGRRVHVGSEEWKEEYGRRVDRIIRALKRRGAAVYWIGLPIVSRSDMNEDVRMLNSVFRERALLNSIKFIDIYEAFADEAGQYTQYGPDLTGKQRLLRRGDGVNFTTVGYRKVAHFVEREIKRDLIQAKNERDIPLAGGEAEQRRISPQMKQNDWAGNVQRAPQDGEQATANASGSAPPKAGPASGDLKAENSKVAIRTSGASGREEAITVEILRPAIPASIVALVSRRQSPDRPAQLGDTVPETLPGGVTVLNSITPGLAAGSQAQRRRLAPTQSPFFKVLVKGERITPKPGRADDFTWPPPEPAAPRMERQRSESGPSIPIPERNPKAAEGLPSHG